MKNSGLLAAGLFLAVTIAAFEATAVITALPTIVDELHGRSLYGLTLSANMLANLVAIVAAGSAADRRGPAQPFAVCAALFVAGLLVAGAAPTMHVVVASRFLQGSGIGGFGALAYVAVRRGFDEERQPRTYALLSAGWVLPSLVAPLIAGTITDRVGWRWVFIGMAPVAAAISAVVVAQLRHLPPAAEPELDAAEHAHRSIVPAVVLAAGAGTALGGLTVGASRPVVATVLTVPGAAVAVVALRRLFPPGWARAAIGVPAAVSCRLLATFAFLGVDSFVPLAADRIHGVSATAQGTVIVGASLTWTAGQALAARNHGRVAPARFVTVGFALLAAGGVAVAPVVRSGTPLWVTFLAWMIGGLGMGLLFNPTTVFAMSAAGDRDAGRVAGWLNMADSLGFATIGGLGGAIVAFGEHGSYSLTTALLCTYGISVAAALTGTVVAARVR